MESILIERKRLYDIIEQIKSLNPPEVTSKGMKIMKQLLNNIKEHPEELKFRIIKRTNLNIANGLMNVKGIYNLLTILGYMATNDGNFLLETSDLNPVELCLNILNTDISIYNEKEYIKEASQLMMQNPEVKKEMELNRKRLEEDEQQKERIKQLIEADKEERKIRFKYNK